MQQWDRVAIVGVGLIGGSIGLALRDRGLAGEVVGVGRRASSLRRAKSVGAVGAITTDLGRGVAGADLVVVCTPVDQIAGQVRQIAAVCGNNTLVTDAGSIKAAIVAGLDDRLDQLRFVGSHPLAGSEKTGPECAKADLFEGRVVIVTPTRKTRSDDLAGVCDFWASLGAVVMQMSPVAHDRAVAATSHVPHVVAAALAAATPREDLPLVAGGWRDTTRIAAGDAELWEQILVGNRANVLKSLARFEKTLSSLRAALEQAGDGSKLRQLLAKAKAIRDGV